MDNLTIEEIKMYFMNADQSINYDGALEMLAEILNNHLDLNDAYRKVCESEN